MLAGRAYLTIGVLVFLLAQSFGTVLADAIDGQWCSEDGRRITIDGDYVSTPGGWKIKGDYDRHHYMFRMPSHELNAGKSVDMVLVSENIVHLRYHSKSNERSETAPEIWRRCKDPVSRLPASLHKFAQTDD